MTSPQPNPLQIWLDQRDLKPYLFAEEAGISKTSLYAFLNDDAMITVPMCMKIEASTGGDVSLRDLADWMTRPERKYHDARHRA